MAIGRWRSGSATEMWDEQESGRNKAEYRRRRDTRRVCMLRLIKTKQHCSLHGEWSPQSRVCMTQDLRQYKWAPPGPCSHPSIQVHRL